MSTSIELVILKCLRCATFIPAAEDEVAWVCAQCGQGQQLADDGLLPLEVHWAKRAPDSAGVRWLPFWVFEGAARFQKREAYSFGGGEPDRLWEAPRRFYVPAFPASIELMEKIGADLTRQQPRVTAGPGRGALERCTLLPEDARQAAEFVVITIEADRKDKLKTLAFQLDLGAPELWLLPFAGEPDWQTLRVG